MSLHGSIYIYAGKSTSVWGISADQTQQMLESIADPGCIEQTDSLDKLNQHTKLLVIPGGNAMEISANLRHSTQKIEEYVRQGGRFLGICAGAIFATKSVFIKPRCLSVFETRGICELSEKGNLFLKKELTVNNHPLYPETCFTQHIVRDALCSTNSKNFCAVDTFMDESPDEKFKSCSYSGPAFFSPPPAANILLRYNEPINLYEVDAMENLNNRTLAYQRTGGVRIENEPAAVLSYPFGKGKIVLSGIHPEITSEKFIETAKKYAFHAKLPKELKKHETKRKLLVDRIFRELNLL